MTHDGESIKPKTILILGALPARSGRAYDAEANDVEGWWIDDFCNRNDWRFKKIPYPDNYISWHKRGAATPFIEWIEHFKYVYKALKLKGDCIVTLFPPRAVAAAVLLPFLGRPGTRLIAWHFNLGSLSIGWKRRLARRILRRVDRFVVHSRGEIKTYAEWLGVEEDRFRFVPLQKAGVTGIEPSPIPKRYVVSMGSANRDYGTLVDAVLGTGIKTVVIGKQNILDSLPEHPDLVKLHGLTEQECQSILSGAELNVVPIANSQTASGQVSFTTSMRMGVATIATRCVGTVDYIRDGENGLLVANGDSAALRRAIVSLWQNEPLRSRIGSAGYAYAEIFFSDEAAGRYLAQVLDEVLIKAGS
jgi:glycosyltransferase involved in cell wall biosynthesis